MSPERTTDLNQPIDAAVKTTPTEVESTPEGGPRFAAGDIGGEVSTVP
jgi:hypothetical protein